jgi:hypothetical protein
LCAGKASALEPALRLVDQTLSGRITSDHDAERRSC